MSSPRSSRIRSGCPCRWNASGRHSSQHYVRDKGAIYWVGTGRMTPFLQRLADAADDGLNPDDYPIDALIELRDSIDA